jgi:hypothetical protein
MQNKTLTIYFALTIILLALAAPAIASPQQYQPTVGQEGKDVIWVPTPEELIAAMLDTAKLSPSDYLVDLGSGDGRIVIAAAKRGARAMGVEYNPDMVELSKQNAQKAGVTDKASFVHGDIFETDFSKATVVTMYLLPDLNIRLRPKILEMKPGTRVVTHAFDMGDWEADQTFEEGGRSGYFWIVPAKAAGTWTLSMPSSSAELSLRQTYQKIDGSLKLDGKDLPLKNAKLEGDQISFSVGEGNPTIRSFAGRVNGSMLEGTMKAGSDPEVKWTATRRAAN